MRHHSTPGHVRQCALSALLMAALAGCTDSTVRVASTGNSSVTPPVTTDPAQPGTQQPGPVTPATGDGQTPQAPGTPTPGVSEPGTEPTTVSGSGAVPLDLAHRNAARFLAQTSFGPRYREITALAQSGDYAAWLDNQFALPASTTSAYTQANSNGSGRFARHEIWWNNALDAPDQLRQRVAFALSQIFVVSDLDFTLGNAQYGMSNYYDLLINEAFGNYRSLLEKITLHPVMGVYLSMVRNEKANPALNIRPDENYAREVLQLFSIGLDQLDPSGQATPAGNPAPAYTQKTVEEFARVFTGWNYPVAISWTDNNISNNWFLSPMVPVESFHDSAAKTLLNGTVLPAGQGAVKDLKDALDNIYFHPNVGPFIATQLIQRLVSSNPSTEYVRRIATVFNNNGAGERGDLKAVIRAILLDDEARNGGPADAGKIKEPLLKLTHFFRAFNSITGPDAAGVHRTSNFPMVRLDEMMNQAVMKSHSVFNFFRPENRLNPDSALLSPEMQILTEAAISATHNNFHNQIYRFTTRNDLSDDNTRVTLINIDPLAAIAGSVGDLVDWLNLVFFSGSMPADTASVLTAHASSVAAQSEAGRFARTQDTLFLVTGSPAFNLQH